MQAMRLTIPLAALAAGFAVTSLQAAAGHPGAGAATPTLTALLLPAQVNASRLRSLKMAHYTTVALWLRTRDALSLRKSAASAAGTAGLKVAYFIEVGRSTTMAAAHPEWMAGLQGHQDWRRLFPSAKQPSPGEVVRCKPWVPVLYAPAFAAHIQRIEALLRPMPAAETIYLNDLQGAPSACGCGNLLCRWTTDYGPVVSEPLAPEWAAAQLITQVQKQVPTAEIIPVWATECEKDDYKNPAGCATVGCFTGTCWPALTGQLTPILQGQHNVGVLSLFRTFHRSPDWIRNQVDELTSLVPHNGGPSVNPTRLVPLLEGWDASSTEIGRQLDSAAASGCPSCIVALTPIDQGWTPEIVKVRRQK